MNKFMRLLVFFDLPTTTAAERKEAAKFRKFLLDDGYHMVQYSVYARVCNGTDAVTKHELRLHSNLPKNGSIRLLTLTEKQYSSMKILLGEPDYDDVTVAKTLEIF